MVDEAQAGDGGPCASLVRAGRESADRDARLTAAATPQSRAILDAAAMEWAMGDENVAAGIIAEAITQAEAATIANVVKWLRGLHRTHAHKLAADFFAAAIENGDWRNG
jgi:hypothetical protein